MTQMTRGAIESPAGSDGATPEAERQLIAAVERHREALASMRELGRPESGQHVAVKALGRAVQLVVFALRSAAQSGVPLDRLMELTGWERQLVDEALARSPDPRFVARLAPAGLDSDAVARAAAGIEATARLQALTQRILADVDDEAWSPAAADLADLHDRLDREWRSWRKALGRPAP
jgi:hypothetical protein